MDKCIGVYILGKEKTYSRAFLLFLQRPALRYPEHFRKLHYNLKTEGRFSAAARSPGTIPHQLHFSYLILVPVRLNLWPQSYRVTCRTQETAVLRNTCPVPSSCLAWSWPGERVSPWWRRAQQVAQERVGAVREKRIELAVWSPGHKKPPQQQEQRQQKQQQRKVKTPTKKQVERQWEDP